MIKNVIQTDPSSITLKTFIPHYTHCGTKSGKECLQYLENISIPTLTESEHDSFEGILTTKE